MKKIKKIVGTRTPETAVCVVDSDGSATPLDWRLDIADHSPTGLEWGYSGSGPTQLAIAILAEVLSPAVALALRHEFKAEFVCGWSDEFEIDFSEVVEWAMSAWHRIGPSRRSGVKESAIAELKYRSDKIGEAIDRRWPIYLSCPENSPTDDIPSPRR